MCLLDNLQECSWKEIKGLEEQKVREEQRGEGWRMTSLRPLLQDVPLSKLSPASTKADPNAFHLPPAGCLI